MSKFSRTARKVFHFLTGQRRVRKVEERLKGLEERFAVTVTYYEQKIDTLINSVARSLQEAGPNASQSRDQNILVFGQRPENPSKDHDEKAQPTR
jgi:hypothetical protein